MKISIFAFTIFLLIVVFPLHNLIGKSDMSNDTLSNKPNSNSSTIIIEGVVLRCNAGEYIYQDEGINSSKIIACVIDNSKTKIDNLLGKKVKLLGIRIQNETENGSKFVKRATKSMGPTFQFHIIKVLSVGSSRYEKEIAELKKICGDKKMGFQLIEQPITVAIKLINERYRKPIVYFIESNNISSNELLITMYLTDIYIYDAIKYIRRIGFYILLRNSKIYIFALSP